MDKNNEKLDNETVAAMAGVAAMQDDNALIAVFAGAISAYLDSGNFYVESFKKVISPSVKWNMAGRRDNFSSVLKRD